MQTYASRFQIMMALKRGYNIEVEGDLREEFDGDDGLLTFSDGTVVKVEYGTDGVWHLDHTGGPESGGLRSTKHPAVSEDDGPRRTGGGELDGMSTYSENLVLEGPEILLLGWKAS